MTEITFQALHKRIVTLEERISNLCKDSHKPVDITKLINAAIKRFEAKRQ